MKNIKYIFLSSIIIFMITFPVHFVYDILNYDIIGILFPTNESIFQHMKMVFLSFFIYYLIVFIIRRRLEFNNVFLTNLISSVITISFFLIIYIPTYFRFGENMIFTFILLFASILLGQAISYNFLKKEENQTIDIICISLIAIVFIIFAYFTFNPMESYIFWDPHHETYERVIK